jgi:hypothetical protein
MFYIFKLIFQFVVFIFFYSKEELNYKSKQFNPLKIFVLIFFIFSIILNIYLFSVVNKLYVKLGSLMCF